MTALSQRAQRALKAQQETLLPRDTINEITAHQHGHAGVEVLSVSFTLQEVTEALASEVLTRVRDQYPGRRYGGIVWAGEHPDGEGAVEVLVEDLGSTTQPMCGRMNGSAICVRVEGHPGHHKNPFFKQDWA